MVGLAHCHAAEVHGNRATHRFGGNHVQIVVQDPKPLHQGVAEPARR